MVLPVLVSSIAMAMVTPELDQLLLDLRSRGMYDIAALESAVAALSVKKQ